MCFRVRVAQSPEDVSNHRLLGHSHTETYIQQECESEKRSQASSRYPTPRSVSEASGRTLLVLACRRNHEAEVSRDSAERTARDCESIDYLIALKVARYLAILPIHTFRYHFQYSVKRCPLPITLS